MSDPGPPSAPAAPALGAPVRLIDAFAVSGYGTKIGVKVDATWLIPLLKRRLPDGLAAVHANLVDTSVAVIASDSALLGPGDAAPPALAERFEDFDSQLRFAIAKHARHKVFVHGGVVAVNGRAAIFPGRTHSGKTHLVAEMIKAGADYISDEHAILDNDGLLHPWFKPLSMRSGRNERQREVSPLEFGARVVREPLPVHLIIATRYQPEAAWNPVELSPTQGALELMANAVAARIYPEKVMQTLSIAAARARTFKTDRPDAAAVIPAIFQMLAD